MRLRRCARQYIAPWHTQGIQTVLTDPRFVAFILSTKLSAIAMDIAKFWVSMRLEGGRGDPEAES